MAMVVIIGGGISGLSVAHRLKRDHNLDATVLEASSRPGGKAQTVAKDGFTCEEATNGWLDKEQSVRDLITELDLDKQVQPSEELAQRRFIYRAGALRELHMHPLKFMVSSALPVGARMRLAIEPFVRKGVELGDETLADFAARRLGKGARDFMIGPMASGVFAGDPSQMSLKSCFGKVHALETNHGSLITGMIALKKAKRAAGEDPSAVQAGPSGRLTSLTGGVGQLVGALARELGDSLRLDCPVVKVEKNTTRGFDIHLESGEQIDATIVISAAPAWAAANFIKILDHDASDAFRSIPYPSLDVVCLGFHAKQISHDLEGFGFLMPRNQGKTILGSLWTSSIFSGRAPNGMVLLRTMIGGMLEPQVAGWPKEEVLETIRRELEGIIGLAPSEKPVFERIFRHGRAIPQYHVGHHLLLERIKAAETRHPGFFAGGNAIGGIGVVDCIRESGLTSSRVADFLASQ
jgi:protoporphyrinogen/coproporphyrinogen III oxidase